MSIASAMSLAPLTETVSRTTSYLRDEFLAICHHLDIIFPYKICQLTADR